MVHYDLKCDNVLLEPLMSTLSDEEFWHPHWPPLDVTSAIPFRVSITDFGQSKVSPSAHFLPKFPDCKELSRSLVCFAL